VVRINTPTIAAAQIYGIRQKRKALILKLYDNRIQMYQLDTFLRTMQTIAREKTINNVMVTK